MTSAIDLQVRTLIDWYRSGGDIDARLPRLSTFLGHCLCLIDILVPH